MIEGDYLLTVADSGVACCFAAKTGGLLWTQRLGEQHASLVSAEGHVYFLNDKGFIKSPFPLRIGLKLRTMVRP